MLSDIIEYSEKLIDQLGVDQEDYQIDKKHFSLKFDGELEVHYSSLEPGLYLMGFICAVPENKCESIYMSLMHMNLFGIGTQGALLGLNKDSNTLTLSCAYAYRLSYKEFRNAIEDFVNQIDFWRQEIKKITDGKKSIICA